MLQLILGLYMTAYAARNGCESMTKCRPQFLPTSLFQRYRSRRSHFRFTFHALTWYRGPCRSHFPSYVSYTVRNLSCPHLGDIRSDHPTDVLAFSAVVYLVVRSNLNRVPVSHLLKTIARDATYYFLVIFTSHFVFVMFVAFASVRISSQSSIISLRLA